MQRLQSSFYSQLLKEVENSCLSKAISIDVGKPAKTEKVVNSSHCNDRIKTPVHQFKCYQMHVKLFADLHHPLISNVTK